MTQLEHRRIFDVVMVSGNNQVPSTVTLYTHLGPAKSYAVRIESDLRIPTERKALKQYCYNQQVMMVVMSLFTVYGMLPNQGRMDSLFGELATMQLQQKRHFFMRGEPRKGAAPREPRQPARAEPSQEGPSGVQVHLKYT